MKFIILLLFCCGAKGEFITTGLDTSLGSYFLKEIIGPIDDNYCDGRKRREISNIAQKYGIGRMNEEAVTNEDNLIRPCPSLEINCIRKFFADNSDCKPVRGPIPDCLYLLQNTLYLPYANVSITLTDVVIKGLSKYNVKDFLYNKKTKKIVFSLEIKYLYETTKKGCINYKRSTRESIVLCDTIKIFFKKPLFTVEMSTIPKLRLDLADIHVFNAEANTYYYVGPKAYKSKEPAVVQGYKGIKANIPVVIQESCLYQSNLLMAYFIQKNICDFGLKLYSM